MIGFFDSGIGGLTIHEEVRKKLPTVDTLYLGDAARAPYGDLPRETIADYTWQGCEWLFDRGCKLVIIACNTATAAALREIQQKRLASRPGCNVLGIIRPTVEAMAKKGHTRIAVLSTQATKDSRAYETEFADVDPHIKIFSHACPRWVGFVEAGQSEAPAAVANVQQEIGATEREAPDADAILLACTHYPYVKAAIERARTTRIPVYAQGAFVATALADYIERHPEYTSKKNGVHQYFTTGDAARTTHVATEHFGFKVTFSSVSLRKA